MGKPASTKYTIHLSYVLDLYETLVSLSWGQAKAVQDHRKAMQWVLVLLVHPAFLWPCLLSVLHAGLLCSETEKQIKKILLGIKYFSLIG